MTDVNREPVSERDPDRPLYGVGPVTIRELALAVVWLVAFVVSFFPLIAIGRAGGPALGPVYSAWTVGITWVLTIGVPTIAVFLIVLRRFSPDGIRRVGSLGIDQFASVAFSVSAVVWFGMIWQDIANGIGGVGLTYSWVVWVEFFLMLAGVVLTVLAPFIPPFADDFRGRPEAPAHRNARPVRAVTARPRPVRPAPSPVDPTPHGEDSPPAPAWAAPADDAAPSDGGHPASGPERRDEPQAAAPTGVTAVLNDLGLGSSGSTDDGSWSPPYARRSAEDVVESEPAPSSSASPFWALAPVEREVHDDRGVPIFTVGPTAWALVIEDRGAVYVIQHEDGRIGYLHDVSGIRRG